MKYKDILSAADELRINVDKLKFESPVKYVYNPLFYAWEPYKKYIKLYADSNKKVIFLGMNPGPWGMAQNGVPFGEISMVKDWLKINGAVSKPRVENSARPVQGFSCKRSEVSGLRLWGFFKDKFKTPESFFREHLVMNYCPLIFMEESGRNITPDKLKKDERALLFEPCDQHLKRIASILQAEWIIGIGGFAAKRISSIFDSTETKTGKILHPSPASPAANRGWAQAVLPQLIEQGIWKK